MHIARILVTTNFTSTAAFAYGHALWWARHLGATVTVAYANPVTDSVFQAGGETRRYLVDLARWLDRRVARTQEAFAAEGAEVEVRVLNGTPKLAIPEFAKAQAMDLIVMAHQTHRDLGLRLLGSTTKAVLHHTDLPVLVVPFEDPKRPRVADPGPVSHIVVGTDLGDTGLRLLRAVGPLAGRLGARITFAHALDLRVLVPIDRADGSVAISDEVLSVLKEQSHRELEAAIPEIVRERITPRVLLGDGPAAALCEAAAEPAGGLIAVGSTGKGFFGRTFLGSTAEAVIARSTVPVLIFPKAYLHSWA